MQRLLKFFVFLLLLSPALAAENDDISNITSSPHIKIESLKEDEAGDLEQGRTPDKIDTLEEVEEASCAVCFLRTSRTWSIGTTGLFDFLGGLGNTAKTALITLSALGDYSPSTKKYLGITSTVISAVTLITNKISGVASAFAIADQKKLQDIENQIATVLGKYHEKPVSHTFKASNIKLSKEDQETIINLQERYKNITSLSGCEIGCFSFLNSFFSCTSSFSQIMEFICNASNLVMVPLATLPVWDDDTARALDITVIIIEAASVFFKQWSQQAKTTNTSITNLKNKLDQYNHPQTD